MPQQVRLSRTLELLHPYARIRSGTTEATGLETFAGPAESLIHIVAKSAATSGTERMFYGLLYLNSGRTGQVVRGYTFINGALAGGIAAGAHFTVNYSAVGNTISTGAMGSRSTLHGANTASMSYGTIAGGMSELYADGSNTNFENATRHSIHRFVLDGDAAGKNTAKNLFEIVGPVAGQGMYTTGISNTNCYNACTEALTIMVGDSTRYIPLATALDI